MSPIKTCLFLAFLIFQSGFGFPMNNGQTTKGRNSILFSRIDNQVKIFIDDKLIYDSGIIDGDPDLNIEVDLNPHLKSGDNFVVLEVLNAECKECITNQWAVRYEVFQNNESVDYVYESDEDKDLGYNVKFTMDYEFFIE